MTAKTLSNDITKGFRIGLGAYFTLTGDVGDSSQLDNEIMNNLSIGLQLKWGVFLSILNQQQVK